MINVDFSAELENLIKGSEELARVNAAALDEQIRFSQAVDECARRMRNINTLAAQKLLDAINASSLGPPDREKFSERAEEISSGIMVELYGEPLQ